MKSNRLSKGRVEKLCERILKFNNDEGVLFLENSLAEIEVEFGNYQEYVDRNINDDNVTVLETEFFAIEDAVSRAKRHLLGLLGNRVRREETPATATSETSSIEQFLAHQKTVLSALVETQQNHSENVTTLPQLSIPKFSGDLTQWLSFRDMFVSTIDKNAKLSSVKKLQYLRTVVTGEAASLINAIPVTADNYAIAWKTLTDEYNNEFVVTETIINRFFKCESVSPNFSNLRAVFNTFRETFEMLDNQGDYAKSRDPWIIYLMTQKLDSESRIAWHEHLKDKSQPLINDFLGFLRNRCAVMSRNRLQTENVHNHASRRNEKVSIRANTLLTNSNCFFCHENHFINNCSKFLGLPLSQREKAISNQSRCFNCFGKGHSLKDCKSTRNCFTCQKRHHTLLHRFSGEAKTKENVSDTNSQSTSTPQLPCPGTSTALKLNTSISSHSSVILPTALVFVCDSNGKHVLARALMDTGAQASFISKSFLSRLGLKRDQQRIPVSCLADGKLTETQGKVNLSIRSRIDDTTTLSVTAHVLSKLTGDVPQTNPNLTCVDSLLTEFKLADPSFNIPSEIQIIIGASSVFEVLKSDRYLQPADNLFLQDTLFGFIVCSKQDSCDQQLAFNNLLIEENSDKILERFWTLEEVPNMSRSLTSDEKHCESIFESTTTRLPCGRFSVKLPFRENRSPLGSSYQMALRRFLALENKLDKDTEFKKEYVKFMTEYESLGHMSKVHVDPLSFQSENYIIPHHGIWQTGPSGKNKLRVVFDASAKTDNGVCLNSVLHVGPRLQNDITCVINNFRRFKFVMTADIEKMYRQISISPEDRKYQTILWRPSKEHPINWYFLNTVTYGESCSPYLALRAIKELVNSDGPKYPTAADILLTHRYVDDILFGHDDQDQLLKIRLDLTELLKLGGFQLKKWATNTPSLLQDIDQSELVDPLLFSDTSDFSIKTLGVAWHPIDDVFSYHLNTSEISSWTKRNLLSEAARLYDPMGWISPITLRFKALFQQTWIRQLDWDTSVPKDLLKEWETVRSEINLLQNLKIPRYLGSGRSELHGFSDASKIAYAAAVYIRRISPDGTITVRLLTSKTKLAPIKQISIPRLELCAAQLLSKIINNLQQTDKFDQSEISLWSDSSTVLAWIKSMPKQWSTFVGNRIGIIHELCPNVKWYYVPSKQNPADIASRGLYPSQLLDSDLWWTGPEFLRDPNFSHEPQDVFVTNEEQVPIRIHTISIKSDFWMSVINYHSNFNRLIRSIAYVLRIPDIFCRKRAYLTHSLSADETKRSFNFVISQVQLYYFKEEISLLKSKEALPKGSKIRSLAPFLDNDGFIRVGGRLTNAELDNFNPQPILLPKCSFINLLIKKTHYDSFHGGFRLICNQLRQKFWILGLRRSAKSFINSCPRCIRYKSDTFQPSMGNLPKTRLVATKPFTITGVDFAGPFLLRPYQGRGKMTVKGYISVFVCFSTKAIHLELIMNLSVHSLIMGIRRFISRRGRCERIISDNGKNFVGCSNVIKEFQKTISSVTESDALKNFLSNTFIEWDFIPVYSPHFGGLWESSVKTVKRHLNRSFNGLTLTIEEFQTALCQIEGIVNSRPLTPISFSETTVPITPAHLLIGEPSSSFPDDVKLKDCPSSMKIRQEALKNLVNGFWQKWRSEYLDTLMRKPKWNKDSPNPAIGDLVIIKRSFDPPRFWHYGRISKLYPGSDNTVRVVDVHTSNGTRRESVRNLIPLLVDAEHQPGGV